MKNIFLQDQKLEVHLAGGDQSTEHTTLRQLMEEIQKLPNIEIKTADILNMAAQSLALDTKTGTAYINVGPEQLFSIKGNEGMMCISLSSLNNKTLTIGYDHSRDETELEKSCGDETIVSSQALGDYDKSWTDTVSKNTGSNDIHKWSLT